MTAPESDLSAESIADGLRTRYVGRRIEFLAITPSTMDLAHAAARAWGAWVLSRQVAWLKSHIPLIKRADFSSAVQ